MFCLPIRPMVLAATVLVATLAGPADALARQVPAAQPAPSAAAATDAPQVPAGLDRRDASEVRQQLRELMRQYPPALARVLRLDPSLLSNDAYLAPYPALAEFIRIRPDVLKHPDYFFGFAGGGWNDGPATELDLRREAMSAQRTTMQNLTILGAIGAVVAGVVWLVRLFIGHRRWIRATRMQSDLNNRLLERMGSNEQLIAYLQSPAAQQLLAAPVVVEPATPAMAAPVSRILWAVQAGVVLIAGGIGLLLVYRIMSAEIATPLLLLGVLAIALGVGFAVASLASYLLSQRFGLLESPGGRAGEPGRP